MPTKPGDPLPEFRVAVEVEDAGDYCARQTDAWHGQPSQKLGYSSIAVIAKGTTKGTTKAERG
jgi:hypothetical protein